MAPIDMLKARLPQTFNLICGKKDLQHTIKRNTIKQGMPAIFSFFDLGGGYVVCYVVVLRFETFSIF